MKKSLFQFFLCSLLFELVLSISCPTKLKDFIQSVELADFKSYSPKLLLEVEKNENKLIDCNELHTSFKIFSTLPPPETVFTCYNATVINHEGRIVVTEGCMPRGGCSLVIQSFEVFNVLNFTRSTCQEIQGQSANLAAKNFGFGLAIVMVVIIFNY